MNFVKFRFGSCTSETNVPIDYKHYVLLCCNFLLTACDQAWLKLDWTTLNRPVSQMRATLAACRELALDYNTYP